MMFREKPDPTWQYHELQLTRQNLVDLLWKLDHPGEPRTIIAPTKDLMVTAVEDKEEYAERIGGP